MLRLAGGKKGGNTFHDGLVGLDAFRRRADDEVCMFYSGLTEAGLDTIGAQSHRLGGEWTAWVGGW